MAQVTVYPNGTADVTVPQGQYIAIGNFGSDECTIYYGTGPNNFPQVFYVYTTISNQTTTLGTFATVQDVRIEAGANEVYYNVGASPTITLPGTSIDASVDPYAIDGYDGTQGGAINLTGGTSSTSANAGGALALTGGTPGATGVGGAVGITSGPGGSTSGASGAVTIASGTATADSASGTVTLQSGAGAASAAAVAGGASGTVTIQAGAGGANTGGDEAGGAGGAIAVTGGAGGDTDTTGAQAAGAGSSITITSGAGGNNTGVAGSGDGGAGSDIEITAGVGGNASGAGSSGDGGSGGSIILTAGTGGTTVGGSAGADGVIINRCVVLTSQGTPAAKTVSATLTAAEVVTCLITVNAGGAAPSALQLPLATAMDTALPDAAANDSFDFSVINISTNAAETASITTNTGWTLVGNMLIAANTAITDISQGRFKARKTGAGAWSLYRIA